MFLSAHPTALYLLSAQDALPLGQKRQLALGACLCPTPWDQGWGLWSKKGEERGLTLLVTMGAFGQHATRVAVLAGLGPLTGVGGGKSRSIIWYLQVARFQSSTCCRSKVFLDPGVGVPKWDGFCWTVVLCSTSLLTRGCPVGSPSATQQHPSFPHKEDLGMPWYPLIQ